MCCVSGDPQLSFPPIYIATAVPVLRPAAGFLVALNLCAHVKNRGTQRQYSFYLRFKLLLLWLSGDWRLQHQLQSSRELKQPTTKKKKTHPTWMLTFIRSQFLSRVWVCVKFWVWVWVWVWVCLFTVIRTEDDAYTLDCFDCFSRWRTRFVNSWNFIDMYKLSGSANLYFLQLFRLNMSIHWHISTRFVRFKCLL